MMKFHKNHLLQGKYLIFNLFKMKTIKISLHNSIKNFIHSTDKIHTNIFLYFILYLFVFFYIKEPFPTRLIYFISCQQFQMNLNSKKSPTHHIRMVLLQTIQKMVNNLLSIIIVYGYLRVCLSRFLIFLSFHFISFLSFSFSQSISSNIWKKKTNPKLHYT